MPTPGPQLDPDDVQGDILRAHGNDYRLTSYLFVGVHDAEPGRSWLRGLLPRVSTYQRVVPKPGSRLNVALTRTGLEALGVPPTVIGQFAQEFRSGMAERAGTLGDSGASHPRHWDPGLGTGAAHILITINAKTEQILTDELDRLNAEIEALGGLSVV